MENYQIISKNCCLGKGGLVMAAKCGTFSSFIEVTETGNEGIVTGRLKYGEQQIRIIAVYGPQETADKEIKQEFYSELNIEIERGWYHDEEILVVGDFNGKLVSKEGKITSLTKNGDHMLNTVEKHKLKVINFEEATKGKWTRIPKDVNQKAILDYIICSENFGKTISTLEIDEEELFCPFKV